MKQTKHKILSVFLSFCMIISCMVGISVTASAEPTETLLTTITATAKEQASYSTANVATVSFSYTAGGSSAYLANWGWWGYGWTATVNAAEGYTITKCVFYDDQDRKATDSEAPFVVETTEEDKTPQVNGNPILADTSKGIKKIEVYGYATPSTSTTEWTNGNVIATLNGTKLTVEKKPDTDGAMGDSGWAKVGSAGPWNDIKDDITEIEIQDGVTSISNYAFSGFSAITSIDIPSSVKSIGEAAFDYCTSLTSVTIPGSVTSIGNNAFSDCIDLTSVTFIPGTAGATLSIGRYAFYNTANGAKVAYGTGDTVLYDDETKITTDTLLTDIQEKTLTWKSAHTHSFTYSADGATITAACTTGCDITEGLTMTISAPTALTYDGTAKEASLSTGYNTTAFPGTYTIEYYNGTTKLGSAPVNAGTYTAKVTAGTGDGAATASVDFTITPKTVNTPTITLSPESFTYDGSAHQPTVTVKDGATVIPASEYNVEYSSNTNAGTATVTITDKTGGNYTVSGTKTFTITAKSVTAPTITLSPESFTYDGTAKEPTVTVKDGTTVISSEEYTVSYSNNTNAGTATVTVTDKTGGNYTVSGTKTFTITAKSVTAPTIELSQDTYTYDGTAKQPTVTVKDGTTVISAEEYNVEYSNNTNAGTATVTITDKTGGNYTVSGTKTFTIAPASQSAPAVSSTNETIAGKADGTITGVTTAMEYKLSTATEYTPITGTSVTGLAAGTYNVRYAEKANYNASPATNVVIGAGNKITVTFNANGGTPAPASQQFNYNQTVSKPATDPTKTGYTFKFWSADGTAEYAFNTPLTANITLTAVYQVNSYTITFDTDGGSAIAAITKDYGATVTAPADPTKTGYTFDGWDKTIPTTMPAENTTIKAQWTVNQYTITFVTNSGTTIAPITADYGTEITAPARPTRSGYAFKGWDPIIPATMPAYDLTVTAQWISTGSFTPSVPSSTTTTTTTTSSSVDSASSKAKMWAVQNDDKSSITVGWEKVNGASLYSLYVRKNGKLEKVVDTKKTKVLIKNPANNVNLEYVLKYTIGGVESAENSAYTASIKVYYKPAVKASSKDGAVILKWNKVEGAEKYRVYKYTGGKLVKVADTEANAVRLKNVTTGKTYKYAVKAYVDGKWTKVTSKDIVSVKVK